MYVAWTTQNRPSAYVSKESFTSTSATEQTTIEVANIKYCIDGAFTYALALISSSSISRLDIVL